MDVEGIRETNEEAEHCGDVHRLGDLLVGPPNTSKVFDLIIGDPICVPRDGVDELQEKLVAFLDLQIVQVPASKGRCEFPIFLALQLQEPSVTRESIVATVHGRHI
jgi:hypothetical protein